MLLIALCLAASIQQPAELQRLVVGQPARERLPVDAPAVHTPTLDSASYSAAPTVGTAFQIQVDESGLYHIDLRSYAFDAYLVLRDAEGGVLIEDDDGLLSTHARIVLELKEATDYFVTACALHGERGDFVVEIQPGAPPVLGAEQRRAAEDYDESERLAWLVNQFGEESEAVAQALNRRGMLLLRQGRLAEAAPLLERAVSALESIHGHEHLEVARVLNNLAGVYDAQARYDKAAELFLRVLAIREAQLGAKHLEVARVLNNLGGLRQRQGLYADAEPLFLRALEIEEVEVGPDHLMVAYVVNNLGLLYVRQGRFEEAEAMYLRVLSIIEGVLDEKDRRFAVVLNNLAALYSDQARYADSERMHRQALAAYEAIHGPDHPDVALSLSNLALLYTRQGHYVEALPLYERALAIREHSLGAEHPLVASTLGNMALAYTTLGRRADAVALHERVLLMREKALGPTHPKVGATARLLGSLYVGQGRLEDAESLLERSLAIAKGAHGASRSEIGLAQKSLAMLRERQGRALEAEALLKEAVAACESELGSEHPWLASDMGALAWFYLRRDRNEEAEALFRRVLAIRESALGPEHPLAGLSANGLAHVLESNGRVSEALTLRTRAMRTILDHLDREFMVMSEADRLRYHAAFIGPSRMLASVSELEDVGDYADYWGLCIEWKGKITRLQSASLAVARHARSSEIQQRVGRLRNLQDSLSNEMFVPEGQQEAGHADRIRELQGERLEVERQLRRELDLSEVLSIPGVEDLRSSLPEDSALVDFYVGEEVYAWVLTTKEEPRLIALGEAEVLRGLQDRFLRSAVTRGGLAAQDSQDAGANLRSALWDPIRESVGKAITVFVSPDQFLCELPFGGLPADSGFLLEKHTFVYLSDVTRLEQGEQPDNLREGSMLAVGDVNYFQADAPSKAADDAASVRSRLGGSWAPLPATREEVQYLQGLHQQALRWSAAFEPLAGKAATEAAVRDGVAGHRYVHIATHGYFEPDDLPSLVASARDAAGGALGEQQQAAGLLPGLLSGLVLAGVNAEPEPGRDDGYLSAEEIQYLDLGACDLAVLSACETALGSARAGEGLMSLRRAFEVAGAKTVVSSLWKVDDRATATLMKHFYENYWLKGMGKAEALHQAKLRMLRQNRADFDGHARPETWGAFVLSGDWR